jgi:hypothetical protein
MSAFLPVFVLSCVRPWDGGFHGQGTPQNDVWRLIASEVNSELRPDDLISKITTAYILYLTSNNSRDCSGFYKKWSNSRMGVKPRNNCIAASRPYRFTPGGRVLGTHWIGGWVGPRTGSGCCGEEKYLTPARNSTPAVQPVARRDATDTGVTKMECTTLHIYFSLEFCL